jgi:uncharacterized protein (TIGR02246 family)
MKRGVFAAMMLGVLVSAAPALASPRDEVKLLFTAWTEALSTGNAEAIAGLYAKDAVLISSLADDPITTPEQRLAYFESIMKLPKLSVRVNEQYLRLLHDNAAVISGLYTFEYENNGKPFYLPARFTFVFEVDNDRWVIVDQHSSQMPPAE